VPSVTRNSHGERANRTAAPGPQRSVAFASVRPMPMQGIAARMRASARSSPLFAP